METRITPQWNNSRQKLRNN